MLADTVTIRAIQPDDRELWLTLWHAYNAFYEVGVSEEVTESTWTRLLDRDSPIGCIVAEDDETGCLLGFINFVIHPRTWSTHDSCYLEDLYVDASTRGHGVGRRLCEALQAYCTDQGFSQIYWHTKEQNETARKLYDKIAKKDDFVRYVMPLSFA